jgi:hypothetical protein
MTTDGVPDPRPDVARRRSEVGEALQGVYGGLTALESLLTLLREVSGSDVQVVEAAVAVGMALRAIGPVFESWAGPLTGPPVGPSGGSSDRLVEVVGEVLRAALETGRAHMETQGGVPLSNVPGLDPSEGTQLGPAPEVGEAQAGGSPVTLYWLEGRRELGAFAIAGAELVDLLKAARRELCAQTGSQLLAALLEAGVILPASSKSGSWSTLVKVARKSRRVVLVRAEIVFPSLLPAPGPPGGNSDRPTGPAVLPPASTDGPPRAVHGHVRPDVEAPRAAASPGRHSGPDVSEVTVDEWASVYDRFDDLSDEAGERLLGLLEGAGWSLGAKLSRQGFTTLCGWLSEAEQASVEERSTMTEPGPTVPTVLPTPHGGAARDRRGRRSHTTRDALPGPAVAGADRLILPGGQAVPVEGPVDIYQLAALALEGGARVVMVHPSASDPTGLAVTEEIYDFQRTVYVAGRRVTIVLLGRDVRRYCGPWAAAATTEDLVEGLECFRRVVGYPWRTSVGRTGESLLRWTHPPERGGTRLGATPTLPAPATESGIEPAYMWLRPLTDAERRLGFVHLYDKNAAYLGVWESVELGVGVAQHLDGPVDVARWVRARPSGDRLVAPPGLWRLELPADPINAALPNPWGDGRSTTEWVTTPTLARVFEVMGLPAISEAWWWPQQSRYLRDTGYRLRDARTALLDDLSPGARLALAAVKDLYRRGTGRLAMGERNNPNSGWPRPDWRHAIVAQARVNLHRNCEKLTAAPFAIHTDGLCIASDEPDPMAFAARIGLPVGTKLGQFSHEGTVGLTPLLDDLDRAGSAAAATKIIKGARSESD